MESTCAMVESEGYRKQVVVDHVQETTALKAKNRSRSHKTGRLSNTTIRLDTENSKPKAPAGKRVMFLGKLKKHPLNEQ